MKMNNTSLSPIFSAAPRPALNVPAHRTNNGMAVAWVQCLLVLFFLAFTRAAIAQSSAFHKNLAAAFNENSAAALNKDAKALDEDLDEDLDEGIDEGIDEDPDAAFDADLAAVLYRNPEERREAGTAYQLTDWLQFAALLEIETMQSDFTFNNSASADLLEPEKARLRATIYNLQLAWQLEFNDFVSAEIIVESEREERVSTILDEAVLLVDFESLEGLSFLQNIELEVGKISLPFGEYYSHFITGPMLEFSETKTAAAVANYQVHELAEFSLFALRSQAGSQNVDWGARMELANPSESIKVGIGYLSDLAESDEQFLENFNGKPADDVAAINAYALFGFKHFELTAEYTAALGKFTDFEAYEDKPQALNLELSWFVSSHSQLSLRYETSKEFAENPRRRIGVNLSWAMSERIQFSLEYLDAAYRSGLLDDEEDDPEVSGDQTIAARFSYQF